MTSRRGVDVAILPTLRSHAGMSMSLYTSELMSGLDGIKGIAARVVWPPFASEHPAGWFAEHWDRYVRYAGWCRQLRSELFHIADHSNAHLLLSLPASRTVITCHDLYPVAVALGRVKFEGREPRHLMIPTAFRVSLLRKAAAVAAISQHTLKECEDFFGIPRKRLYVAYHGVSIAYRSTNGPAAARLFEERLALPPGQIKILHVGSNDPRKNLKTVFHVVAALREAWGRNVSLIKVGAKFGPRETRAVRELGLQEVVHDLGPISAQEIAHAYRACDVLLYPSFHEGFCRPVAEAMACGLPVVASNHGAIPEVVQGTSSLFDPEDVPGIARQIVRITESYDLREEMVERGKQAAEKFTWEAHGEVMAGVYRAVARPWV